MAPTTIEARVVHRPESEELRWLPEGPLWLRHQRHPNPTIAWVAIQHGKDANRGSLNFLDLRTGENTNDPVPGRPGFIAETDRPGCFLVGLERRLVVFDRESSSVQDIAAEIDEHPSTLINDGTATSYGAVFGTKDPAFASPLGSLYLYRGGSLTKLREGQKCSNGKVAYEQDGAHYLLDIDTPTLSIVRYRVDVENARLRRENVVVEFDREDGFPDGMIATPDGKSVIVAFYHPGDVESGEARQISLRTGQVTDIWKTPGSPRVTCPCLVEFDGSVKLLLTTATEHMDEARRSRHGNAGCLFLADTTLDGPVPCGDVVRFAAVRTSAQRG